MVISLNEVNGNFAKPRLMMANLQSNVIAMVKIQISPVRIPDKHTETTLYNLISNKGGSTHRRKSQNDSTPGLYLGTV